MEKTSCVPVLDWWWKKLAASPFRTAMVGAVVLGIWGVVWFGMRGMGGGKETRELEAGSVLPCAALPRQQVSVEGGKVRAGLQYRIISFHKTRADKRLIRMAHDLGFNGVMIQIDGSTVEGVKLLAQRDAKEGIFDYCHQLGMQVTVWVHEVNDVPEPWMPEYMGEPTEGNSALWATLEDRYEWVLHEAIPKVDGLVLTVVETQVNSSDAEVMGKLAKLIGEKCRKYGKQLIVRTFAWYPEELAEVMEAVGKLPQDQVIMSKCVPQDWQMRGTFAAEIGKVGGRPQIVEYDIAGEYFLKDQVANCMPELLKKHFDYGVKNHVAGICVRVDRDGASVLHEPSEVNLWTMGMLASGASDHVEEIWQAWAANRFGAEAAGGVVRAMRPTQEVVEEILSIGPFTFGDTRYLLPLGDEDVFGQNWQNWWWDTRFEDARFKAEVGDAEFTKEVEAAKGKARRQAELSLADLELVRDKLKAEDYAILKTKLTTNRVQLEIRSAMAMAILHYRRMINAADQAEQEAMDRAMQGDLEQLRAAIRPVYAPAQEVWWLGRSWWVGPPEGVSREKLYKWAYQMDQLRKGEDPRPVGERRGIRGEALRQ